MAENMPVGLVPGVDYKKAGGAGAKLIARRPYRPASAAGAVATYNEAVPAGANYLIVRAFGPGGDGDGSSVAGAGGAFAREDRACAPGQAVGVSVPSSAFDARVFTTFSLGGTIICSAQSGLNGNNPGTVAGSIGTVRAAGGNPGQAGTNGGAAGAGTTAARGGGSGGEVGAVDELAPGGAGGNSSSGDVTEGQFPGGGGSSVRSGAKGYCVAEFWSAKP